MQGQWGIIRGTSVTYPLIGPNVDIGRDESNYINLGNSQSISKKHAVLMYQGPNSIQVKDLNSRNGTFVNRNRIQNGVCKIFHGDVLRFGYDPNSYRLELSARSPINSPVGKLSGSRFGSRFGFGEEEAGIPLTHEKPPAEFQSASAPNIGERLEPTPKDPMSIAKQSPRGARSAMSAWQSPIQQRSHVNTDLPPPLSSRERGQHQQQTRPSYTPLNLMPMLQNNTNRHLEDLIARNREKEVELAKVETERKVILQKELESLRNQLSLEHERLRVRREADTKMNIESSESMLAKALQKKIERIEECTDKLERRIKDKQNPDKQIHRANGQDLKQQAISPKINKGMARRARNIIKILAQKAMGMRMLVTDNNQDVAFALTNTSNSEDLPDYETFLSQTITDINNVNDTLTQKVCERIAEKCKAIDSLPKSNPSNSDLRRLSTNISPANSPKKKSTLSFGNTVRIPGSPTHNRETKKIMEMNNMYKQYVATLQSEAYQLRTLFKEKDDKIEELESSNWAQKLQSYQNRVRSLERHIRLEFLEKQRLFKMFGELSQKVEKTSSDGIPMGAGRTALTEFVQNNSKKLLLYKAELAEMAKRKDERARRWSAVREVAEISSRKLEGLERALKSQRDQFQSLMEQKDMALMKANRQLASISGSDGGDRRAAAKFLIDTLNRYVLDQNQHMIAMESLETSLRLKMEENQRIKSDYQSKLDKLSNAQRITELQDELAEERQHNGAERIAKLDSLIGELHQSCASKDKKTIELSDEMRALAQKWPSVDEGATVAFLSNILKKKDDALNEFKLKLAQAEVEICTLKKSEESLRRQSANEKEEMENIQNRHEQVNKLLHKSGMNMGDLPARSLHNGGEIVQKLGISDQLFNGQAPAGGSTRYENPMQEIDINNYDF